MEEFLNKLGYRFTDLSLLMTALTHPSYGGDHHVPHYQRQEFLGDAVLELCISEYLYSELPEVDEGKLTRIRAALVREETLHAAALNLGLGAYIRLSVGEEHSGGREKPSILADVMEAVFAAVYLDGGFEPAKRVILKALGNVLRPESLRDCLDAKSRLQEKLQRRGGMPVYTFVSVQGPPHAPVFEYTVSDGETLLGSGVGASKKEAQQAAAEEALKKMGA